MWLGSCHKRPGQAELDLTVSVPCPVESGSFTKISYEVPSGRMNQVALEEQSQDQNRNVWSDAHWTEA